MQFRTLLLLLVLLPVSGWSQTYYEFYTKGLENAESDSFDLAKTYFEKALLQRNDDNKQSRTYGVHFIEYFPNRELGILYYKTHNFDQAIAYLEKSLDQEYSERAEEYMLYIGQEQHEKNLSILDTEPPKLEIESPKMFSSRVFKPVSNHVKQISILGRADDPGGLTEIIVNDAEAVLFGKGQFKADIPLSVGQNEIFVRATDKSQNSITRSYLIYRADTVFEEINSFEEGGRYYALIIGISNYKDPAMTDLDNFPVEDTKRLVQILTEGYSFEKENIIYLKNPTRSEILNSFDNLYNIVTEEDNLLIFYAGHGYYDEETELGYWLPADAQKDFTANWIYNDVLVANVKRIKSKHTLLISDACFSGSIFKTRALEKDAPVAFQKKHELKSRKAITSGVLKTVPNKSIFFKYLADKLENNQSKYLSGSQLFQDIEIPVANNSPNTPQYGVIHDVGDEGGDFIFIRGKSKR